MNVEQVTTSAAPTVDQPVNEDAMVVADEDADPVIVDAPAEDQVVPPAPVDSVETYLTDTQWRHVVSDIVAALHRAEEFRP